MIICLWIRPELWLWTMLIWLWHWLYEFESGGFSLEESFGYGMDCMNVNILVWLPWSRPLVKSSYYKICFSSSYFTGCLSTVHTAAAAIPTSSRGANPDFLSKSQNCCYRWWQFGKMDIFAAKCSIAKSKRLWQNTSDAWDPFSFLLCVVAIVCMTSYKQLGHFGGNCVTAAISRKYPFMLLIRHLDTIPLFPLLEPAFLPGLFCWKMFIHLEFFAWKCFLPGFCLEMFSTWNPSKVQLPNLSQQVCSSKGK